jgi:hypothetical protein
MLCFLFCAGYKLDTWNLKKNITTALLKAHLIFNVASNFVESSSIFEHEHVFIPSTSYSLSSAATGASSVQAFFLGQNRW